MKQIFLSALIFFTSSLSGYNFCGTHFVASFRNCDRDRLTSVPYLLMAFEGATNSSFATILDRCVYRFPNDSVTAIFLLSESHASLHTYPEHNSCFVDLFTCGDACDWKPFLMIMKAYLNPDEIEFEVIPRS